MYTFKLIQIFIKKNQRDISKKDTIYSPQEVGELISNKNKNDVYHKHRKGYYKKSCSTYGNKIGKHIPNICR